MNATTFSDILYVSDGRVRRADIVVEGEYIAKITDKEEIELATAATVHDGQNAGVGELLLPGIIDEHVHTREPGLTHKGDLTSETRAAAAGGVTTIMDMPNVVPQTTTLEALAERQALGAAHAFVNYSFYFGATNANAALLPQLDPTMVPAVKLFMGSSTGGMLVDHGEALHAVFEQSPLPIMTHCEDSAIIAKNMREAQARFGDDPAVCHHSEIRSREACVASTKLAVELALKHKRHLHVAHLSTADELEAIGNLDHLDHLEHLENLDHLENIDSLEHPASLAASSLPRITAEVCLPHLLFCDEDYATLGTRIKCNPAVKTRADRDALRLAIADGRIATVGTDHAPHLLSEKEGGCKRAASGMPMVQFSLVAMLQLMEEGIVSLPQVVALMSHHPAQLFAIRDRGFIREGMKADLTLVQRQSWVLNRQDVISRCAWSPLEGRTFSWRVAETYCNGRLIYDHGTFADGNHHAQALRFERG